MLENITPNRRHDFGWPIFDVCLMLFRVPTLQVLEITVPKFIDFGRWTIFVTRLMLFRVITLEMLENIMRNRHRDFRWKIFGVHLLLFKVIMLKYWKLLYENLLPLEGDRFLSRLMLFGILTLETRENVMRNRRQHSGVTFRNKKDASRWGFTIAISRDGIITAGGSCVAHRSPGSMLFPQEPSGRSWGMCARDWRVHGGSWWLYLEM